MRNDAAGPLADCDGFEWDDGKQRLNAQKHGIDFVHALEVFNDPKALLTRSPVVTDEPRYLIVGVAMGRVITVIFTRRGSLIRLISARAARRDERNNYGAETGDN